MSNNGHQQNEAAYREIVCRQTNTVGWLGRVFIAAPRPVTQGTGQAQRNPQGQTRNAQRVQR